MPLKPCAKSGDSKVTARQLRSPPPKTLRRIRGDAAKREQPRDTFQVVIQCASEEEQERLYDEFRSRNFSVRLLTM
jgi:hypothetical protein